MIIAHACNSRGVLCNLWVIPLRMYHNHQKYIENGASVAGIHSVRGLGLLLEIASAQYFLGYMTVVPDLSRWVPSGCPEVTRESFGRVVCLNRAERAFLGFKGGISVRQRV